ncbi:hypothetical protein LX32DRAFT_110490 [Colletotrichum zoysiae]|uniref:Uncharacterized protein n=1 Tax=Colletotrichum zoysiae TaxID=1216348 RepID=A0AAD9H9I8_9PEZI|nr:hypothetical protein LX32DRAFT_110490 [Colletotrichum zoysiae]
MYKCCPGGWKGVMSQKSNEGYISYGGRNSSEPKSAQHLKRSITNKRKESRERDRSLRCGSDWISARKQSGSLENSGVLIVASPTYTSLVDGHPGGRVALCHARAEVSDGWAFGVRPWLISRQAFCNSCGLDDLASSGDCRRVLGASLYGMVQSESDDRRTNTWLAPGPWRSALANRMVAASIPYPGRRRFYAVSFFSWLFLWGRGWGRIAVSWVSQGGRAVSTCGGRRFGNPAPASRLSPPSALRRIR